MTKCQSTSDYLIWLWMLVLAAGGAFGQYEDYTHAPGYWTVPFDYVVPARWKAVFGRTNDRSTNDRADVASPELIHHPAPIVAAPVAASTTEYDVCDDGWHQHNGHCYSMLDGQKSTWFLAVSRCKEHEAQLASIHSRDENEFIKSLTPRCQNAWIGLNAADRLATWIWFDGTTVDFEPDQHNFKSPSVVGNSCAFMFDGIWNSGYCALENALVCKKPAQKSPVKRPDSAVGLFLDDASLDSRKSHLSSPHCPEGWAFYRDSCYASSGASHAADYFAAETECRRRDAHLASVQSLQEDLMLAELANCQEAWIGHHSNKPHGAGGTGTGAASVWEDGTTLAYANWIARWSTGAVATRSVFDNEPLLEDQPTGLLCAFTTGHSQWDQEGCNARKAFVCKKPAAS